MGNTVIKRTKAGWDKFFLGLCKYYSTASKDPSTKVGCVITDGEKEVVSMGWNGFRPDVDDTLEGLENREFKLLNTVHAEINALERIPYSKAGVIEDFSLSARKLTLYVYPFLPCSSCAISIGMRRTIDKIVSTDYIPERWKKDIERGLEEFKWRGIEVITYPIDEIV